eukprot:TRINITY_DN108325_c0_g1_i1.p1 TRINITY_DN108325_c0_g1~~TRINITY_DN108325_c0_g1_i1.p1  ORF type:complete len:272 (-),score=39.98 TRINITY_DN108325_c0_g1_i1:114-929(-)
MAFGEEHETDMSQDTMYFGATAVGHWDDLEQDSAGHVRWKLPLHASVDVLPPGSNTECYMVATENKRGWGQDGDGFTVCASADCCDFAFRTKVFGRFPDSVRRHNKGLLNQKQWNTMELALSEKHATYFLNGKQIATIEFRGDELPSKTPFIGMYAFTTSYKARNFRMRSLQPRIVTMQPIWHQPGHSQHLRAVCCSSAVAGFELCTLDAKNSDDTQLTLQTLVDSVAAKLGIPALLFGGGLDSLQFVTVDGRLIPLDEPATSVENVLASG